MTGYEQRGFEKSLSICHAHRAIRNFDESIIIKNGRCE